MTDPDFGQVFPCPCRREDAKDLERRRKYADLPHEDPPRIFENFSRVSGAEKAFAAAQAYANGEGLIPLLTLHGRNGCGKSHLLEAIGRRLLEQGKWVKYALAPQLLDELRSTYSDEALDSYESVYRKYASAEVLLLDDIGMGRVTDYAIEKLTMLVDDRYRNQKPLVMATNLSADQLYKAGWGARLADRVHDVGSGTVEVVTMDAPSYRTTKKWQTADSRR